MFSADSQKSSKEYRLRDEFIDYTLVILSGIPTSDMPFFLNNKVERAIEKKQSRPSHPHFEDREYHVALRHGEYAAQVDKAMSALFRFFLGYGPE
jgi:hypothetical protein